jgi:hypothetical protein
MHVLLFALISILWGWVVSKSTLRCPLLTVNCVDVVEMGLSRGTLYSF